MTRLLPAPGLSHALCGGQKVNNERLRDVRYQTSGGGTRTAYYAKTLEIEGEAVAGVVLRACAGTEGGDLPGLDH